MKTRSYVLMVLLVAALAPVSTAAFNLAVDPYDFRGMLGITAIDPNRINLFGPEAPVRPEWLGKTFNVRWYQPDTVVFGSSSAGSLLASEAVRSHPEKKFGARIFHFSVAGPSIGALKLYFLHTAALLPPKQAVLELQFFMFNADRYKPTDQSFLDAPFAQRSDYDRRFRETMLQMSVETRTTRDSIDMMLIRAQTGWTMSRIESELAAFGAQPAPAPAPASVAPPLVTPDEFRRQFTAVDRAIYAGIFHHKPNIKFIFTDDTGYDTFDDLKDILYEARRRGIKLRVYLAPSHVRMYEMITHDGHWALFEEWKRRVARIVADDAAQHPDDPITLWDFAGYNSITTEPFPTAPAPTLALTHFLDTVHWNASTRDLLVDRLFNYDDGRAVPDDFGVRLTPRNVEAVIASARRAKAEYEAAHKAELDELRAVMKTVK